MAYVMREAEKVNLLDAVNAVTHDISYRGYVIYYDPPPIPDRRYDWHFYHRHYDGEGDPRHGDAASLGAAMAEIDEQIEIEGNTLNA
jgi:hypothetical protein